MRDLGIAKRNMKELRLQAPPTQMLTLVRTGGAGKSTHCEIRLSLVTRSFRGTSSARIDGNQWRAFVDQVDRVARGECRCAELQAGRAGLSLQVCSQGETGFLQLICNMRHPSFLDAHTAIYATGGQFTVDKEEIGAWLHESVSDSNPV